MTDNGIFNRIQKGHSLTSLFSIGIGARIEGSERVHLDGRGLQSSDRERLEILSKSISYYKNKLIREGDNRAYVVVSFENLTDEVDPGYKALLSEFEISIESSLETKKSYDHDNEQYIHLFLFKLPTHSIDSLIMGQLNRHMGLDPYHMCDVFIMDTGLSGLVNLYDDRGIDYAPITTPHKRSNT